VHVCADFICCLCKGHGLGSRTMRSSGSSWGASQALVSALSLCNLHMQGLLSHCDVAAGLLVLLISGRLTLSNISPLALTLSNTYGVPLPPSLCLHAKHMTAAQHQQLRQTAVACHASNH